jgi:hypothetical protein
MPGMGRAYPLAQSWFRRRIPERKAYDKLHTLREGLDVYYLYRSGRQLRLRGGSATASTAAVVLPALAGSALQGGAFVQSHDLLGCHDGLPQSKFFVPAAQGIGSAPTTFLPCPWAANAACTSG